jgi:large subunit ribosomal protein L17
MRHRLAGRTLSRSTGQRKALYRNLVTQLLKYGRIETTEAKAKAIRGQAEKMITLAKRGGVHCRRQAAAQMNEPAVIKSLFDEIGPRYAERPGGYTRIIKLGMRQGDAAEIVVLELVK